MIIAGNWKMNLRADEAVSLVRQIVDWTRQNHQHHQDKDIILFPPSILIPPVIAALGGEAVIAVGGQDCHRQRSGAHTGDIAAPMLADSGCSHVLLGHSERRQNHGEDSVMVAAKAETALECGLMPMICVGESLAERESGKAEDVIAAQIRESLPAAINSGRFSIAYEPVWAIGTGVVPAMAAIKAMHDHIRNVLADRGQALADTPILYGGSVKPDNAAAILGLEGVDGALVGGASLVATEFTAIAEAC